MTGVDDEFEALYRGHRPQLLRLAFLLTGSTHVAEDMVQEAFIRLHVHLVTVREPVSYVRRIIVNGCREHHRRVAVEQRHAPTPPGPSLPLEIDQTWEALWQLPERQRAAPILRFYEDLTVREVAATLGCRLGTAKSVIHRGVGTLRKVLSDDHRR